MMMHDEIMTALEACIQLKLGSRCISRAWERFPEEIRWVLTADYEKYWAGVFRRETRLDGSLAFGLVRNWQAMMEVNRAQLWKDKAAYLEGKKQR